MDCVTDIILREPSNLFYLSSIVKTKDFKIVFFCRIVENHLNIQSGCDIGTEFKKKGTVKIFFLLGFDYVEKEGSCRFNYVVFFV